MDCKPSDIFDAVIYDNRNITEIATDTETIDTRRHVG